MLTCSNHICTLVKLPLILLFCLVLIEIDVDFAELHRNIQENGVGFESFHNPNGTSVWRRRHRIGVPRHPDDNNNTSAAFVADQFQSFFDRMFHHEDQMFDGDDDFLWEGEDDFLVLEDKDSSEDEEPEQDHPSQLRGYLDLIEKGDEMYGDDDLIRLETLSEP
jgi:hypothetical protein